MATHSKPQQWTDYVDVDDVRRKFLTCGCIRNGEHLFQVYEPEAGAHQEAGFVRALSAVSCSDSPSAWPS